MTTSSDTEVLEIAQFRTLSGPADQRIKADVHFNPESLQYSVQNSIKEEGKGAKKKQHVSQTSAKLSMQLVFDTTDSGEDVRVHTDKMAKLLQPYKDGKDLSPPLVEFGWGVYRFTGIVEQYKETIDFFAAQGVPLRSTVDITLASQDVVFDSHHGKPAKVDADASQEPTVHRQADNQGQNSGPGGASGLANALGDPRAARAIASMNGAASLRFDAGGELSVSAGVSLQAAADFSVGASAGIGIGGGIGGGIGAGLSAGIGGGVGFSAGLGGGIGGGLSAGISGGIGGGIGGGISGGIGAGIGGGFSASAGSDFSGLRASSGASLSVPSGRSLFTGSARVAGDVGSQFSAGGRAQASVGASLSADVGAQADVNARISFN